MLKHLLQRGLLVAASAILGLLALEGALTLWYGTPGEPGPWIMAEQFGSPYVFTLRPGSGSNNLAMRRTADVSRTAPPGSKRILSYGDSIAAGYGLAERETYSELLEQSLRIADDSRHEVLNMARGHSPTIYSFHVRRDVPELNPLGVVLQIELLNDVPDEARTRTRGRDADGLPLEITRHRYILGWDGHILAPLSFFGSALERTKLYAKVSHWLGRNLQRLQPNPLFASDSPVTYYSLGSDRYFLSEEALSSGFDRLFEAVAGIHAYLERRDIRFLLLIMPSRHVYADDQYTDASLELLQRAEARARELGLPHLSLHAALGRAGGAALFMDFCHPTAAGHRAIAAELEPILSRW